MTQIQIETSVTGWVTLGREPASQWLTPLGLETDSSRRRRPLKVLLRFKIFPQFICLESILRESHPSHWYVLNWILFQTLRDQIKYINVFVIAFKQTDTRMTYALRSMISLFEKMFGDGFWNNAILEVQCQIIYQLSNYLSIIYQSLSIINDGKRLKNIQVNVF